MLRLLPEICLPSFCLPGTFERICFQILFQQKLLYVVNSELTGRNTIHQLIRKFGMLFKSYVTFCWKRI